MKNKEIQLGAVLSYVIIALTTLSGMLYTPFMLRQLGQSEYGLYSLIGALVGYISICDFGLHNTIYRFISKYQAEKDNKGQENFLASCLIIYGFITILILIAGVILYFNLGSIFSKSLTSDEINKAKIMFIILVFNMAITLPMGTFQYVMRGYEKFIFVNSIIITRIILRTLVLVGLLSFGYRSLSIVIVDTIFNIATEFTCFIYCLYKLKIKIRLDYLDKDLIKQIFNYSAFVFILAIVNQVFWKIGQVALGIISTTSSVAIYAVAINLVIYYEQFSLGISEVFIPKVTGMITRGATNEDLTDLMVKIGRIQFSILGLVLTGYILLGKQFIFLWAGSEYSQTYWISLLLFISMTIPMSQTIGGVILKVKNMQAFKAYAYLIMALFNLLSGIILAKKIGAMGIAIATAFSVIIFQIVIINLYYHFKLKLGVIRFFKETFHGLIPTMIVSLIIGSCTLLLPGEGWISLFIRIVLVSIVYIISIWFIGLSKDEKGLLPGPILKAVEKLSSTFEKNFKTKKMLNS